MGRNWKSTKCTRTIVKIFWIVAWVFLCSLIVPISATKILGAGDVLTLAFGTLGLIISIHQALCESVTRHELALARLKYLKKKLQTDESGSIRNTLNEYKSDQQELDFKLQLILNNYEFMFTEVEDYVIGGIQSWAWK
jgi:hypothetical protein